MKNATLLFTILIAITLAGCNESKDSKAAKAVPGVTSPNYNGHYVIEAFVLDGDCEQPEPFEIIIWGANIYENVAQLDINVTGTMIGKELSGIVDYESGEQAIFEAAMVNSKNFSGDWYLTDGTCVGYLTGSRIIE